MNGLVRFVAEILGADSARVDASTGPGSITQWDSMGHMQLVAAIEERYGVQFSVEEIPELKSVSIIADRLAQKGAVLD